MTCHSTVSVGKMSIAGVCPDSKELPTPSHYVVYRRRCCAWTVIDTGTEHILHELQRTWHDGGSLCFRLLVSQAFLAAGRDFRFRTSRMRVSFGSAPENATARASRRCSSCSIDFVTSCSGTIRVACIRIRMMWLKVCHKMSEHGNRKVRKSGVPSSTQMLKQKQLWSFVRIRVYSTTRVKQTNGRTQTSH